MPKKRAGATLYEKRGDDFFDVSTTEDGDIVEIQQYDSIGHRHYSINFFTETAPRLVALIQKAAGIKVEKREYEYNINTTDTVRDGILYDNWSTTKQMVDLWDADSIPDVKTKLPSGWTLVRRIKPGKIEEA